MTNVKEIIKIQELVKQVFVSQAVKQYIVEIVRQTREHPDVFLGSSPRGSLGLFRASQVRAALHGREFVLPDDVKALAKSVLSHRIVISAAARMRDLNSDKILDEIIYSLPVPASE